MKKCAGILFFILTVFAIVFFVTTADTFSTATQLPPYPPHAPIPVTKEPEPVPLETQLGQLFMIGHWADTPVASTTALIEKYQPGGIIIMSAPENPHDILTWTQQWNAISDIPLLIAIDQEGGPVSRLKSADFTQTGQREITTPEQAYRVGLKRGQELSKLGINMNFAPVLDTAQDPNSFMYSRTFPKNTNHSLLAAQLIAGMADGNVIAVVKHFPGHDDTNVDSHTELPVVNIEQSELSTFSQSFTELFQQNPPKAIMTAHVQFPLIDAFPATLSAFFLRTYLREELGYAGLIITDGMSMDAIDTTFDTEVASLLAIEAGANIILLAAEPTDINTIFPSIHSQAIASPLLQKQIADSYNRILSVKPK